MTRTLLACATAWAAALSLVAPARAQLFGEPRPLSTEIDDVKTAFPVDIDSDGDVDIISRTRLVPGLTVYLNDGTGAFPATRRLATDFPLPLGVGAGDMDGDGDVDLLLTGGQGPAGDPKGVWYVEASAPGDFLPRVLLLENTVVGERIEVVDLDADGDLDAFVAGTLPASSSQVIVENLGGGALIARLQPGSSYDARPLDFDADGFLDLIQVRVTGRLSWARARAPLIYETSRTIEFFAGEDRLELGDLDGDGLQDLVTATPGPTGILVFPNLGGAEFGDRIALPTASTSRREHVLVDVDLDGDLDIVEAPRSAEGPNWFRSDGALGFTQGAPFASGATTACEDLRVADIDGDGLRDLVIAGNDSEVLWIRGNASAPGDAKFESSARPISASAELAEDVVALDVDLDGDEDVVAASLAGGVAIARGDGVGGQRPWAPELESLGSTRALAVGDLDDDGADDLALRTSDGGVVFALAMPGGLGAPVTLETLSLEATGAVWLADADGDGDLDLFANEGAALYLFRRVAPASFAPRVLVEAFPRFTDGVAASDLDGDGIQDLVLAVRDVGVGEDQIIWRRGDGSGGYGGPALIHEGARNLGVPQIRDGAGVSRPSLYVADRASGNLLSYGVAPSGSVEPPQVRRFGIGPVEEFFLGGPSSAFLPENFYVRPSTGPMGDLDIVWDPEGNPSTAPEQVVAGGIDGALAVLVRDLDGDGDRDVVYARRGTGDVFVAENRSRTTVGVEFCGPASPNSSGESAQLTGLGVPSRWADLLTLRASGLPPGATTLFLVSRTPGITPNPAGSEGDLCLGGTVGRFVAPGFVGPANGDGVRSIVPDVDAIPAGAATFAVASLDTLYFQAWYRDGAASNFTTGLAVQFE